MDNKAHQRLSLSGQVHHVKTLLLLGSFALSPGCSCGEGTTAWPWVGEDGKHVIYTPESWVGVGVAAYPTGLGVGVTTTHLRIRDSESDEDHQIVDLPTSPSELSLHVGAGIATAVFGSYGGDEPPRLVTGVFSLFPAVHKVEGLESEHALSPDGTRLAGISYDDDGGKTMLMYGVDSDGATLLGDLPVDIETPYYVWLPDSSGYLARSYNDDSIAFITRDGDEGTPSSFPGCAAWSVHSPTADLCLPDGTYATDVVGMDTLTEDECARYDDIPWLDTNPPGGIANCQ